jgi:hypothetical protein
MRPAPSAAKVPDEDLSTNCGFADHIFAREIDAADYNAAMSARARREPPYSGQ